MARGSKQLNQAKELWDRIDPFFKFAAVVASSIIFLFTTFATITALKEGLAGANSHTDAQFRELKSVLGVMIEQQHVIDERTWEMHGRMGHPPVSVEPLLRRAKQ